MKDTLRETFWPLLRHFESTSSNYQYRALHRRILLVVGALFSGLAAVSAYFSLAYGLPAGLMATTVFVAASSVCLIVAGLGSDAAVARIWNSRGA